MDEYSSREFLDIISSSSDNWHYQTFSDKNKGDKTLATTYEGKYDDVTRDVLEALNKNGAGVFVAINRHRPRLRRTKKTTERVNAVFCDFDDDKTARDNVDIITSILPASIVVESSPGRFHVYYVIDGVIPLPDFSLWQKHLAREYRSDPKIIDPSRVMRIPGFYHGKGETPFMTRMIPELTTGKRYSLDELVSTFYGGRNNWLTSIAGHFRRNALPIDDIQKELEYRNSLLNEPLNITEIDIISGSISSYDPHPDKKRERNAIQLSIELNLDMNKDGRPIPTLQNTFRVVHHERVMQYNCMSSQVEVVLPVPWDRITYSPTWTDFDTIHYLSYLIDKYDCEWGRVNLEMAIDKTAGEHKYDPLVDYLNSLEWDGEERVSTALIRHLHVEDDEYSRAATESLFVGAVKRAFEPGSKHDTMVVLVGDEGSGKSKFCSVIARYPDFFADSLGDLRNKDSVLNMQGKWIIEFGELKSLQGISSEHTKAFISSQVDNIRLPFGKRTMSLPRRCIFIGTTNNPNFITDCGDNRRYLPLTTPLSERSGKVMNYKALEAEVDQLWAEAVQMYRDGHRGVISEKIVPMAMAQRVLNVEDGGYAADVIRYVNDTDGEVVNGEARKREYFIPREFYLAVVEGASREKWMGSDSRLHRMINNAARKVLREEEWKFGKYKMDGTVVRGWKRV